MELWNIWVSCISNAIQHIALLFGISEALAIITFTFVARCLLMPISLRSAFAMHKNKMAIERIKPEIEKLRARYRDEPQELSRQTLKIYKKNGFKLLDRLTILNIGIQGVLGLGIFQSLRQMVFASKFMWIGNIAKPDVILAILVGVLTYFSMLIMPGTIENQTFLLYLIPAIISTVVLISFPSALGIYWATSNIATVLQTSALHLIINRNSKAVGNT